MSIYNIEMIQDTSNNMFANLLTPSATFTESSSEMLPALPNVLFSIPL